MVDNKIPLVCICIPTYNAASTIRETLVSILEQTYPNIVIHVVDNASSDETVQVASSLSSPRIVVHSNPENVGAEGNFNRCIQLATGKYAAIFHADDLYESDMVASQVAFLEQYESVGAVFTEASVIDEKGQVTGEIRAPQSLSPEQPYYGFKDVFKAIVQHSNFLICPSVMVRTDVYQNDIKEWRGHLFGSAADLDVWLRIARLHDVGIIRKPLMRYRLWTAQWSAKIRMSTERAKLFDIVDHYLAEPSIHSMLDSQDWINYKRLERRDRLMRAVNLFLQGEIGGARVLCHDIFSKDAWIAAFQSQRGFLVLMLGGYMKLLFLLNAQGFGAASLAYLKRKTNT